MAPRKIGMKSVQREGMDYEFDVVVDIDSEHHAKVSKTRCSVMDGRNAVKPGPDFFAPLIKWLDEGEPPGPKFSPATTATTEQPAAVEEPQLQHASNATTADAMTDVILSTAEQRQEMALLAQSLKMPPEALKAAIAKRGVERAAELTLSQANDIITGLRSKAAVAESSMSSAQGEPASNQIPF